MENSARNIFGEMKAAELKADFEFNASLEKTQNKFERRIVLDRETIQTRLESLMAEIASNKDFRFIEGLRGKYPEARVYLVGGAIRDYILGSKNKDFDFIFTGISGEELEEFLNNEGKCYGVDARSFGVYKFQPEEGEEIYDIALPRTEQYTGLGYKDVEIELAPSVEEDLGRRDFTFNAVSVDVTNNELVDPNNGLEDLQRGQVMAVGEATRRFTEDPSRILRGIRFACVYGFDIEENTFLAMKELAPEINRQFIDERDGQEKERVAREVVAKEFLRSFNADPLRTIELYEAVGLLEMLLPEVAATRGVEQEGKFHAEGDVWEHTMFALRNLPKDAALDTKLAVLFHDLGKVQMTREQDGRIIAHGHEEASGKAVEALFKRLKLDSAPKDSKFYANKDKITWLVLNHMKFLGSQAASEVRPSKLEKYFLGENKDWGEALLQVMEADINGTIRTEGKEKATGLNILLERIAKLRIGYVEGEKEKKPLLSGEEIIKALNIQPGPEVGRIKAELRDLQLEGKITNKEEAFNYLKETH